MRVAKHHKNAGSDNPVQHLDPDTNSFLFFSEVVINVVSEKNDLQKIAIETSIEQSFLLEFICDFLRKNVRMWLVLFHHQLLQIDEKSAKAFAHSFRYLCLWLFQFCLRRLYSIFKINHLLIRIYLKVFYLISLSFFPCESEIRYLSGLFGCNRCFFVNSLNDMLVMYDAGSKRIVGKVCVRLATAHDAQRRLQYLLFLTRSFLYIIYGVKARTVDA